MGVSFFLSYQFDGIISFAVKRGQDLILFCFQGLVYNLLPVLDLIDQGRQFLGNLIPYCLGRM